MTLLTNAGETTQTVICGDCLPIMKGYKDKQFDLVLCDPPYGINVGKPIGGGKSKLGAQNLSALEERERVRLRPLELKGLAVPKVIGDLMTLKSPQKKCLTR